MPGGWSNDLLSELIVPNNVPFLPGNAVTGIGSQVPAELIAAGYPNAIVFYATDWNPAAVTQSVKFRFIAASAAGLVIGYGAAANPSVDQTAVVVPTEIIQTPGATSGLAVQNTSAQNIFLIGQDASGNAYFRVKDSAGNIRLDVVASGVVGSSSVTQGFYDNLGVQRVQLTTIDGASGQTGLTLIDGSGRTRIWGVTENTAGNSSILLYDGLNNNRGGFVTNSTLMNVKIGAGFIAQTFTDGFMTTTQPLMKDGAYSSIAGALVNGWTADVNRPPVARLMADDTVAMRGFITKAANPAPGELWLNALSSAYRPITTRTTLTATPGRAYNGSQIAEVLTNGTCRIWDMAALPGAMCLDQIRYSADNVP